jgi:membrane fusion protein (multidrug efflux system)
VNKVAVELHKPTTMDSIEAGAGRASAPRKRGRKWQRLVLAVVVLGVAGAVLGPWLAHRWSHVSIDDARVAGNLIAISSEVSGRVTAMTVIAGDAVKKGQLLASIDREPTVLELQALDARVAGVDAQQAQLRAQQDMIRSQVRAKLAAGQTQVRAAEAAQKASEVALQNAHSRLERVGALAKSKVMSEQVLEEAQAALATAEHQKEAAAASTQTAVANLDVIRAEEAQIAVLDRQIITLEAQKSAMAAEKAQKQIELARREIRAEFDGVIDNTYVDAGEYVGPGSRLLIYHDPNLIWIDANVKETDFQRLKIGAPATISVDAYPGAEFRGEIIRLGQAATSQFALLPSPNPSGNFTKITQRLPVRVSLDQREGLLRPGMMVELSIDVVD